MCEKNLEAASKIKVVRNGGGADIGRPDARIEVAAAPYVGHTHSLQPTNSETFCAAAAFENTHSLFRPPRHSKRKKTRDGSGQFPHLGFGPNSTLLFCSLCKCR
jgi:hypothetical protein